MACYPDGQIYRSSIDIFSCSQLTNHYYSFGNQNQKSVEAPNQKSYATSTSELYLLVTKIKGQTRVILKLKINNNDNHQKLILWL